MVTALKVYTRGSTSFGVVGAHTFPLHTHLIVWFAGVVACSTVLHVCLDVCARVLAAGQATLRTYALAFDTLKMKQARVNTMLSGTATQGAMTTMLPVRLSIDTLAVAHVWKVFGTFALALDACVVGWTALLTFPAMLGLFH